MTLPKGTHRHASPRVVSGASPLSQLHNIRHRYGAAEAAKKLALVARLERRPPRSARGLGAYHDDLLFLRAFPDNVSVLKATVRALARMEHRVRALARAQRRHLDDLGVAGTTTRYAFAFGTAQWMVNTGADADIDWDSFDAPERLDLLLRRTLTQAESDAFDSGEFSTRGWLAMARGGTGRGALAWLLQGRDASAGPLEGSPVPAFTRHLYESVEMPLRWHLTSSRSTTGSAVADVPFHARTMMRPSPVDAAALITTPLPSIERLTPTRASAWLDAARTALATRCREVHAITYANIEEVYLADLGEGTALCLIGAAREDRLSLETNYGYVLFSNGVPVGYGGVTPLAAQANTGVNIFDAFRHAEASMLFAQTLRACCTLFGVTRFVVNPYQFGADNDEALASGAYWFYDRLGFRPVDPTGRALADRERARRVASRNHRSSHATLRRLAAGDLVLELPGAGQTPLFEERWLISLARAVTESLAAPDVPTRLALADERIDAVARTIGVRRWRASGSGLRFGMQRLGPVVALILDEVARWPERDRRALLDLLRAKGATQERDFALASRAHKRLWTALRRLCRSVERGKG